MAEETREDSAKPAKARRAPNKAKKSESATKKKAPPKTRSRRNFPTATFENSLLLASTILSMGSGAPVKRLTLFDHLDRSPESSASRELVTNSSKYGLTTGSYKADELAITELGRRCVDPDNNPKDRLRAQTQAGILGVDEFRTLYEFSVGKKLPSQAVLKDELKKENIADDIADEAVETFILNATYIGLLKVLSGSERVLKVDDAIDHTSGPDIFSPIRPEMDSGLPAPAVLANGNNKDCFVICPIGEEDSVERRHSDVIFGTFIEPIAEEFGLNVIRADKIAEPGMITRQVLEKLVNSRLVIADLSFNNPNVFYELAIRHALRRPIVQLIRKGDKLPFDVGQGRTIHIELTDVYSAIPALRIAQTEISANVRNALSDDAVADSPISTFFPSLRVVIDA